VDRLAGRKAAGTFAETYDVIYLDAVSDYSVPFQLTTLEFVRNVRTLLAPGGAYLMNLIDAYEPGLFLGAAYATLRQVFDHVYVLTEGRLVETQPRGRATFILLGVGKPFDTAELGAEYAADCKIFALTEPELAALTARSGGLVLTDDHAPVENLLATVVRDSSATMAIDEWRRLAQLLIRQKKYDRAITVLKDALAFDESQYTLRLLLGNALILSNRPEEAMDELNRSMEQVETASGHVGLATALTQLGRFADALPHRLAVIRMNPKDAEARLMMGNTLVRLGRVDEALKSFGQAVELRPQYPEAYLTWASVLAATGKPDEALTRYREAIRLKPDYADAHLYYGRLLLDHKRYDEAIDALRQCLKWRPDDAGAQFEIGNAYYLSQRLDLAAEAYLAAVRINPTYSNAYLNVALIRESQGRLGAAQAACEQAIRARPDDDEARRLYRRIIDRRRAATTRPYSTTSPIGAANINPS
jgi:tetratricopeptide (TPR) repeat protein